MSKGGAGKVYFILYLAVLLELLIIIVERDEAELNLKKEKKALQERNKQIQLIAETIINSMRGSATSVSSTSDQSMVLGDEKEAEGREFSIRVRVADPARDSVKNLELHLLRNEQEVKVVNIALDSTLYPRTRVGQDYIFKYKFRPEYGEGQYKLRFDAKTNQIVGVAQGASPDDTVKIGAVKLTVRQLTDVRDGIGENIALRSYIDSLLTGMYENFTSNIGSNEFVVNVKKKAATVFDQLAIFPQENNFAAFPGLALPNPIRIEGAEAKNVKISISGQAPPGSTMQDSVFIFAPKATDIGQTYTIKLRAQANRNGGEKDVAATEFSVEVKPLVPVKEVFWPVKKKDDIVTGSPYGLVPFQVNGKYAGLDNGTYRVELYLDGVKIKESNEPSLEWTPTLEDVKKTLQAKILFRSSYGGDYVSLKDTTMVIATPPLLAGGGLGELKIGEALDFKAALGIAPKYIEIEELVVTAEGYFDEKPRKIGKMDFSLRMNTGKANQIKDKAGKIVNIVVTDPKSGASNTMQVRIVPAKATKGSPKRKM